MLRLLGAAAAMAVVVPHARAMTRDPASSAEAAYMRARAAEMNGALGDAAAGYAAALALAPGDEMLAGRAFRQAMAAGDHPLATRVALLLDVKGKLPEDGTLLLLSDAVAARDWPRARQLVDRAEREGIFAFMAPVLRAWIAVGAKDADALAQLSANPAQNVAAPYVAEHRALLLLATGKADEGIAAIEALGSPTSGRTMRLDLAAASQLLAGGQKDRALALLRGDDAEIVAARALIAGGRPLPGAVSTPAEGIAELFARVAMDVSRERVNPLATSLARLSTFLAPGNSETWIAAATLLAAADQYRPALTALDNVPAADPLAADASDLRVQFLMSAGDSRAALAEALKGVQWAGAGYNDWLRVGDLYVDLDRQQEAADAYQRAIALASPDPHAASDLWSLWLRRGGALGAMDQWPAAKAALTRAVELAPDQPAALNYLGYAQLERHENLDAAEKLIERASALRPDDGAITDSLGWSYYLRGKIPEAVRTLERAVASDPGESTMNEHLGDAYWAAGRRFEARGAWAAALVYAEQKDAARIRAKIDNGAPPAKP